MPDTAARNASKLNSNNQKQSNPLTHLMILHKHD